MADRFAHAYLSGDARTTAFVPNRYDVPEDRARAVAVAAERSVPVEVQHTLQSLNGALTPSAARDDNLSALSRPGTACVVTGQQVGLFLGPLYTLYKAAAAIVTARALSSETGRPVVPIFWLQSEDHDFEEVATAYVPQTGAPPMPLTAAGDADSRVSMNHRRFGDDLTGILAQLSDAVGRLPHAEVAIERLRRHYRPKAGWVEAFAGLLGELFAPEGLLLINPRVSSLNRCAGRVHRQAVAQASDISDRLTARQQALVEAGFSAPVFVRPGAPLCFFHPDGPGGPRYRLVPAGESSAWTLVGADRSSGSISQETLDQALETDARCFSTSALLRPVLQDSLLPTAAYVGGPGEIDYFAQLGPVYSAFDLAMPLLVPRARFAVVEPKVRRAFDDLQLTLDAFAKPEEDLLDAVAARPTHLIAPDALHDRLMSAVREELARLGPELDPLQTGLKKAADKTEDTIERACSKFVDKYKSALNLADSQRVETIRRIKSALFPLDAPQERIHSFPYYAARCGDRAFVERVLERCRPYHPNLEALEL